jgi:CheY-like chemotaxis protein
MSTPQQRRGRESGLRRRSRRVLVVDDSEEARAIEVCALSDAGYNVIDASDGFAALQTAALFVPDVIVLDFAMPGMDGLTVARRLSANAVTRDIPIVVVTACAQYTPAELRAACAAFLVKPFDLDDLIAAVQAVDAIAQDDGARGLAE